MKIKGIPSNVIVFGLISFLTDTANDMIYPLLPLFLTQYLGAGQDFLGLVEGCSDSAFAFFTFLSGLWTDRVRNRGRMVITGYTISCISKPLMAIAWHPWAVLFLRVTDRIGKGIRTSPRDALISHSVSSQMRGKAYGLQRSLDNAGSISGPIIASLLLMWFIKDLRQLFWLAMIPALCAIVLAFWKVREIQPDHPIKKKFKITMPQGAFRMYLVILFLFTLGCSSDAFLLLRASELGVAVAFLPLIWVLLNIVKSITIMPFGMLSDSVDRIKIILAGRIVYTAVYIAFAFASQMWHAWVLFAAYGLFYGLTEGSERAILVDYTETKHRGETFGWYYLVVGAATLPASIIFGLLWKYFGSKTAFLSSAGISALSILFLLVFMMSANPLQKGRQHA